MWRACHSCLGLWRYRSVRPRRLAWPRTPAFHVGNTGSNPVGDALPLFFQEKLVQPQRDDGQSGLMYFPRTFSEESGDLDGRVSSSCDLLAARRASEIDRSLPAISANSAFASRTSRVSKASVNRA